MSADCTDKIIGVWAAKTVVYRHINALEYDAKHTLIWEWRKRKLLAERITHLYEIARDMEDLVGDFMEKSKG